MPDAITDDVKRMQNAIAIWALTPANKKRLKPESVGAEMHIHIPHTFVIPDDIQEILETLEGLGGAQKLSDGSWEIIIPVETTRGGCDESAKNMG